MGSIELAQCLKRIREERGLGLREVSRRSMELAWDSAWSISPAQLLQLERGRTKKPGLLKLSTLALVYGVKLDDFTLLLGPTENRVFSKGEAGEIRRTLSGISRWLESTEKLEKHRRAWRIRTKDEATIVTGLYRDLVETIKKVNLPLVPASDGQPPVPFGFAERRLNQNSLNGKTRRTVFRLLLSMKGSDLEDCAAAFLGVSSRRVVKSEILLGTLEQVHHTGSKDKRRAKPLPAKTKSRGRERRQASARRGKEGGDRKR